MQEYVLQLESKLKDETVDAQNTVRYLTDKTLYRTLSCVGHRFHVFYLYNV